MCIRDRNTPVSAEITKTDTSISTMSDNKPDGTAVMIQLLLNKFDEKFDKFDIQFNELKNEIKGQNFHLEERINTVETRCDNIQKTTLAIVDDKFNSTISELDTKIDLVYDTVNNTIKSQLESNSTEIQQKCLNFVEGQIEVKTNVLQNHVENIEINVIDITKNLEAIDSTCLLYTSRCV